MTDSLDTRPSRHELDDVETWSRSDEHRKPQTDRTSEAKMRACLICKQQFLSAWAGERVCSKCKSTSAWRGGVL
jgi:hypothetical protein